MTDEEMYHALGALVTAARKTKGKYKTQASAEMGISESTLRFFEQGKNTRFPQVGTLYAIEDYFGWRRGALAEVWKRRREIPLHELTVDMLLPPAPAGLLKASHLTDSELMAELNFRFLMRDYRADEE